MNKVNLKSRKMRGYIVFLIDFGIIIAGIDVIGVEDEVEQHQVAEERIMPLPYFIRGINIYPRVQEYPENIDRKRFNMFFTAEKLLFNKLEFLNNIHDESSSSNPKKAGKKRVVFRHERYFHDLLEVACEKVMKFKDFPHIIEPLFYYDSDEFETIEVTKLLFNIKKDTSKLESGVTGLPTDEREAVALGYVTYLSFWLTVHFRICFLTFHAFDDLLTPTEQQLKAMCMSNFEEMFFAFTEFRNILENALNANCYLFRNESNHVRDLTKAVMRLSFGSVFKKNEETSDLYFDGIISWSRIRPIKANNVYCRMVFPNIYKGDVPRREMKEFNFVYHKLYGSFSHHFHILRVLMLTSEFSSIISGTALNEDFLSRPLREPEYFESSQIWRLLLNNQTEIDPNTGTLERLNNVIQTIHLIRNFHYTITFLTLPN